jgi:transcriptional regulator with XRE-family HTH domain
MAVLLPDHPRAPFYPFHPYQEVDMRALDSSRRPAASPPTVKRRRAPDKTEVARAVSEHVARRLKSLRIQTGRTQTEMGTMLGMTFQQAAKYERGLSKIAPGTLWRLAEFFGVGIEYFFAEFNSGSPEVTLPDRAGASGRKASRSTAPAVGVEPSARRYRRYENAARSAGVSSGVFEARCRHG